MRSLFVSTERCRFGKSASLRMTSVAALVSGVALTSTLAVAAEPVVATDDPQTTSVTQSTTTTVTTNAPSVTVAPLPPPPSVAPTVIAPIPVAPQPMAPTVIAPMPVAPPPAPGFGGSFQGPVYFNGPVWIIPAQPGGQMMVQPALPQQLPPPPVYVQPPRMYAPPPRIYAPLPMARPRVMPVVSRPAPRGPVFGMGVRFTTLGIRSQEVFGEKPTLMGGGVQLRFRNQGHWGFELALDAMKANIADSAFVRTSYPFTFAPMLYIFKNRPETHFNIYATAGFGLMASDIALYQGSRQERNQQFWEVLGQAGGGMELRFTRLAIFADVRGVGMLLDQGSEPGKFYDGITSGPIAPSSIGYKVNLGAMLWF